MIYHKREAEIVERKRITFDFERSLQELEALIEKMETGNLSLEESLRHFERGVALTRACQKALSEAEQKVKILLEKHGKQELGPFGSDSQAQEE